MAAVTEKGESSSSGSDVALELLLRREPVPKWRLAVILACIGFGLFLSLMDATIVATMLYSVSVEFGGFRLSPWLVLSYSMAYVGKCVMACIAPLVRPC